MIQINEFAPRTLEITLSGKIEKADIEQLEGVLDPYVEDEGSVSALIDMTAMSGMTWDALLEDAQYEARLFAQIEKFGRIALITDSDALGAIVKAFDAVMPTGEFARFNADDRDRARNFVADLA